ncbi:MAG: response regulator [Candidatus Omnitrophota bacterium]|jgi:DNA-binding response OmpR family regulator
MAPKILIIDDCEQDKKVIKRILNKAGYEHILLAASGKEGVKVVKSNQPDLVILDTVFPDTDGFEVCRLIRQIEGITTPKIIMMTGSVDAVDAVKARKAGALDYCVKTTDCAPLLEAVKNLFIKGIETA